MSLTRRTLMRLGLAAAPGLLAAACGSATAPTAPPTPSPSLTPTATPHPVIASIANGRVLVVGDSLTFAEGASRPTLGYAFTFVMGLRARGTDAGRYYLLHGISGITTGGMLACMQQMGSNEAADLVVVELGTNDPVYDTPLDAFASDYTRLLAQLRAASPTAHIVALTCWRDPAFVTTSGHAVSAYNAIIADTLARRVSGPQHCIDLGPLYLTPGYHHTSGDDTFHPNDDGHAAIAQAILAVV